MKTWRFDIQATVNIPLWINAESIEEAQLKLDNAQNNELYKATTISCIDIDRSTVVITSKRESLPDNP